MLCRKKYVSPEKTKLFVHTLKEIVMALLVVGFDQYMAGVQYLRALDYTYVFGFMSVYLNYFGNVNGYMTYVFGLMIWELGHFFIMLS